MARCTPRLMNHRVLVIAFFFVAACSVEQRANTCIEGSSAACTCTNGHSGAQVCSDGAFGSCLCDTTIDEQEDGEDLADPKDDEVHDLRKAKDMTKAASDMAAAEQPSDLAAPPVEDLMTTPVVQDLKTVSATPDLAPTSGAKRFFVTKTLYKGGAVLNACQTSADAASLGGTWVPWLSTAGLSAKSRVMGTGPWKTLGGVTIFSNAAQLGTTPSTTTITDETGVLMSVFERVWTGTANGGSSSGLTCLSWSTSTYSTSSSLGTVGRTGTALEWTDYEYRQCDTNAHVYCFEQ